MRFEARAVTATAFDAIDRYIHAVAIDRVAPGMPVVAGRWRHQLPPVGAGQKVERPRKTGVQHVVAVVSRQFVEDHRGIVRLTVSAKLRRFGRSVSRERGSHRSYIFCQESGKPVIALPSAFSIVIANANSFNVLRNYSKWYGTCENSPKAR